MGRKHRHENGERRRSGSSSPTYKKRKKDKGRKPEKVKEFDLAAKCFPGPSKDHPMQANQIVESGKGTAVMDPTSPLAVHTRAFTSLEEYLAKDLSLVEERNLTLKLIARALDSRLRKMSKFGPCLGLLYSIVDIFPSTMTPENHFKGWENVFLQNDKRILPMIEEAFKKYDYRKVSNEKGRSAEFGERAKRTPEVLRRMQSMTSPNNPQAAIFARFIVKLFDAYTGTNSCAGRIKNLGCRIVSMGKRLTPGREPNDFWKTAFNKNLTLPPEFKAKYVFANYESTETEEVLTDDDEDLEEAGARELDKATKESDLVRGESALKDLQNEEERMRRQLKETELQAEELKKGILKVQEAIKNKMSEVSNNRKRLRTWQEFDKRLPESRDYDAVSVWYEDLDGFRNNPDSLEEVNRYVSSTAGNTQVTFCGRAPNRKLVWVPADSDDDDAFSEGDLPEGSNKEPLIDPRSVLQLQYEKNRDTEGSVPEIVVSCIGPIVPGGIGSGELREDENDDDSRINADNHGRSSPAFFGRNVLDEDLRLTPSVMPVDSNSRTDNAEIDKAAAGNEETDTLTEESEDDVGNEADGSAAKI